MNLQKTIASAFCAGLLILGLSACEKEGPAEKAGKAIDEAASDVAHETEEAKEAIEEKMKQE